VAVVDLERLDISPLNARKNVGDVMELADSIRVEGILQPLLVRPVADRYEIIAGSRRFAAAREAGLSAVPVVVRSLTDGQALAASLTENLQRGDLSLEERAEAYKKLQALDPVNCGSHRGLARAIGRTQQKISQDFEAYEALVRLRPQGIQVITQLSPTAEPRRRGEAIPERHANLLQQAVASVRAMGFSDEAEGKYADLARAIAPLDLDDARRVLDQFKMYPERPVADLTGMALAKVEREVRLDAATARRLDELATGTGGRWEDVITSLVESPEQAAPATETPSLPRQVDLSPRTLQPPTEIPAVHRPEVLELPEESVSEQIIGKTLWNVEQAERAGIEWDFYTIGYSQKSIRQFIDVLKSRKVSTLVDIRHDPISMYKPDFSKENLRRALEADGIAYVHIPDLGVPREIRAHLAKTANWEGFFKWYDANVVPRLENGLMEQLRTTAKPPIAFMCVEQNPTKCHRHRVALALGEEGLKGADL
jgi:ParB/RepB/Spo0J family partition protein